MQTMKKNRETKSIITEDPIQIEAVEGRMYHLCWTLLRTVSETVEYISILELYIIIIIIKDIYIAQNCRGPLMRYSHGAWSNLDTCTLEINLRPLLCMYCSRAALYAATEWQRS